jgi:hypothetical protein
MDRLDELMAELDAAVARLDDLAAQESFRPPALPPDEAPPPRRPRLLEPSQVRWYWTTDPTKAPAPPAEVTETAAPS